MKLLSCGLVIAGLAVASLPARGDGLAAGDASSSGFVPRVPISALARPNSWFDSSRLHLSTSVSVGSGFGSGTQALQVTSLSYQFAAPLWMNVSLGNAWGSSGSTVGGSRSSMFLEGLDLAYRPLPGMMFRVQYRDYRSPLQYSGFGPAPGNGFWGP